MSFIDDITPKHIRDLVPYASAKRELLDTGFDADSQKTRQAIWLNANESPYCPLSEDKDGEHGAINRYPDPQPTELIARYAAYAGVTPEQVLVTRGADEGIELLVRTFCIPGKDSIMINPPTYGMYHICARTFNLNTRRVPLNNEYQLDLAQIIGCSSQQSCPKLIFICSPNNPTGELIAELQIRAVLDACKDRALVVVDEAYIEFCAAGSVVKLISQYANLVVLRTLSKAFALAGIRCGFTLAQSDTIAMLQKVIAPYPVPMPVEQLALQALSATGIRQMQQQVTLINQQKQQFIAQLGHFAMVKQVIHSDTNFVLLRVSNKQILLDTMRQHNILIRDRSAQPTLDNCVRISIGTTAEMQAVLDVFALSDAEPTRSDDTLLKGNGQ